MRSRIRTSYIGNGKEDVLMKYLHGHDEKREAIEYLTKEQFKVIPMLALNEVSLYIFFNLV